MQESFEELLDELPLNIIDYSMNWASMSVNVSGFSSLFRSFINTHVEVALPADLQRVGLNVSAVSFLRNIRVTSMPTSLPSLSITPSFIPTEIPSLAPSVFPTGLPSKLPSSDPSIHPSVAPSGSLTPEPSVTIIVETEAPSIATNEPTLLPSSSPSQEPGSSTISPTIVAVITVGVGAAILIALFFFLRLRKRKKEQEFQAAAAANRRPVSGHSTRHDSGRSPRNRMIINTRDPYRRRDPHDTPKSDDNVVGMISPSDSLLSTGNSLGGDSVNEQDGTHHLADEFDQYKDQNLEKMRMEVNETLSGADGMMSKAVFLAFIDTEEKSTDPNELYWGGSGDPTEIEASALCEVNDFLKRKDGASLEERRAFMQYSMNKMVVSVRHGVIEPEQASHTIHECAAMLALELAAEIPEITLIVTGMRKTVTKTDVIVAFRDFGEIEDAAVSANARGFGLVRFSSPKSVQRAMNKYQKEEIVVQDVAVTVKVLSSNDSGRPVMEMRDHRQNQR